MASVPLPDEFEVDHSTLPDNGPTPLPTREEVPLVSEVGPEKDIAVLSPNQSEVTQPPVTVNESSNEAPEEAKVDINKDVLASLEIIKNEQEVLKKREEAQKKRQEQKVEEESKLEERKKKSLEDEVKYMDTEWDWSQNDSEITIKVILPASLGKVVGKSVAVKLESKQLQISVHGSIFIQWELYSNIKETTETQWTMETDRNGLKVVIVEMQKEDAEFWPYVINRMLPYNSEYYISDEELATYREEELKDNKQTDEALNDEGIQKTPEVEEEKLEDFSKDDKIMFEEASACFKKATEGSDINLSQLNEAIRILRVLALSRDNAQACLTLFELYAGDGWMGAIKNIQKAVWFLHYAANTIKSVPGYLTLARFYEMGINSLPQSYALALRYFQLASQAGHCTAMAHLASLLMRGTNISDGPPNEKLRKPKMSVKMLDAAKRRGCVHSYIMRGNFYLYGEPEFPKDLNKAEAAYEKAKTLFPEIVVMIPVQELLNQRREKLIAEQPQTFKVNEVEESKNDQVNNRMAALEKYNANQVSTKTPSRQKEPKEVSGGLFWSRPKFWENTGTIALGCLLVASIINLAGKK